MMQTLKVKLETTPEQAQALLKTMHQFNAACNYVAKTAFELHTANKIELQKIVYHPIREQFEISAQMAVRAISKACEAYKRDRSIKPEFDPDGAVIYDHRIMSWKGLDRVSLLTLDGRIQIPIKICKYHGPRFDRIRGQADLILKDGVFYLCVVVDTTDPLKIQPNGVLGFENTAVDLTGNEPSGEKTESIRVEIDDPKADLKSCGTKSARKHLFKVSGREARYQDTDHCISKELAMKATGRSSLIAPEDLQDILDMSTAWKPQRLSQHNWSFHQLRQPIENKAAIAGGPVMYAGQVFKTQECPICSHRGDFCCTWGGLSGLTNSIGADGITQIAQRVAVNLPAVPRYFAEPQAPNWWAVDLVSDIL